MQCALWFVKAKQSVTVLVLVVVAIGKKAYVTLAEGSTLELAGGAE